MRILITKDEFLQSKSYRDTILLNTRSFSTRMDEPARPVPARSSGRILGAFALLLTCWILSFPLRAQDWVKTGTSLGVEKVRLAVSDFKPATTDPQNTALLKTF